MAAHRRVVYHQWETLAKSVAGGRWPVVGGQ
jgi:hypothetical protein